MGSFVLILAGCLGVCQVWSVVIVWRAHRLMNHAYQLDALLAKLCVEAFAARHTPIWAAWTAAMGDISVEISQTRKLPDHS